MGGCPFLLEVRAGPTFSGPSVFLMLVVGPSFSGLGLDFSWVRVGRAFLGFGLAVLSWGSGWPCFLGVLGFAFLSWGEGWPSFLGPVRLSHAGGWPFLLWVGVGLSLALPSWGVVVGLLGVRVLAFPCCFLLGVWWLALPSWGSGWPCFLGVWVFAFPSFCEGLPSLLVPVRLSHAGGWPFLLGVRVGLSFLGFGFWPFLLGVRVGLSFLG